MARVKVELPDSFPFTVLLPIRVTDLNYGAHLANDALLSILHEARVRFLQHFQLSEFDPVARTGFIMADVAIEYKGEGFHGDMLHIMVGVADLHAYGFDVVYWVKNQLGREIARAKTGMLCFDYNVRKLQHMPDPVAALLRSESR